MKLDTLGSFFGNLFKRDDTRFMLGCGFKFSALFLFVSFLTFYLMWIIISINNIYFESYGFLTSPEFKEAFFDNALEIFYGQLPYVFGFVVLLFFAGLYVGKLLIRPFDVIGKYALSRTEGRNEAYNPDLFSDYKLLTRFSEFFFRYLEECLQEKVLKSNTIPPNFAKIRGPQFEKVFFFHFFLIIILIAIISATLVVFLTTEIQGQLVNLSISTIAKESKSVAYFISNQNKLIPAITYFAVSLISAGYIMLCFHLYGKVSGAIFGFFATMRSFMKGNHTARVHLIGYAQIRPHGRALNKYLDHIERECEKDKNKVKS